MHRLYETVSPPLLRRQRILTRPSAKWRNATRLQSRADSQPNRDALTTPEQRARATSEAARSNWKRVGEIARRAGADDAPDVSHSDTDDSRSPEERADHRRRKGEQKSERDKTAKMMDLQYFLEMVDQKHRYGSNLRAYHEYWKKASTNENFFYWLDKGEGRNFEHPTVSRERLEKEQVRYLSREERLNYMVQIDNEGRLCWAKNGERINTTTEYKDSVNGIVPVEDDTPAYGPNGQLLHDGQTKNFRQSRSSSLSSSSSSSSAEHSDVEGEHYVNEDLDKAKGFRKIKHVSAATILNHLLRSSVKPNSWIFVSHTPCPLTSILTSTRSPIHPSVSTSASSNRAPSSTPLSSTARAYPLQVLSASRMVNCVACLRCQVTTGPQRRTSALSSTACKTTAST